MSDRRLSPLASYLLYRLGGAALPHIPPHWGYHLSQIGSVLLYALASRVERRVNDNVRHVMGHEASRRAVRCTTYQTLSDLLMNYYIRT